MRNSVGNLIILFCGKMCNETKTRNEIVLIWRVMFVMKVNVIILSRIHWQHLYILERVWIIRNYSEACFYGYQKCSIYIICNMNEKRTPKKSACWKYIYLFLNVREHRREQSKTYKPEKLVNIHEEKKRKNTTQYVI